MGIYGLYFRFQAIRNEKNMTTIIIKSILWGAIIVAILAALIIHFTISKKMDLTQQQIKNIYGE